MSAPFTVIVSVLLTAGVMAGLTAFVIGRIRRTRNVSARPASQPGVQFVVSNRRWQGFVLDGVGLLLVVLGVLLVVFALVLGGSAVGGGIPGVVFALVGLLFLWMGRGVSRARLEVTPDSVWVFRWSGAPRRVYVNDVTRLAPLTGNNYGGVVAYAAKKKAFSASRLMLGYPTLIEYLHANRADLSIPDASWPF